MNLFFGIWCLGFGIYRSAVGRVQSPPGSPPVPQGRPMMLRATDPQPTPATPAVVWDDTPCPLCGRRDEEFRLEAPDPNPGDGPALRFAVVRCKSCGLTYTNPRPDEDSIGRFYPPDYR